MAISPATQGDANQKTTKRVNLESSIRVHSFEVGIKIGIWIDTSRSIDVYGGCTYRTGSTIMLSVKLVSQESELPCNMIGNSTVAVQYNLI